MKQFGVRYIPIKDKHMVRDMKSRAVLCTDLAGLQQHKDKVRIMEETKSTQERLNKIEGDLSLIKELLMKLVK